MNITIACSGNAPSQTAHSGRRGLSGWPHDNGGIPGRKVSFASLLIMTWKLAAPGHGCEYAPGAAGAS